MKGNTDCCFNWASSVQLQIFLMSVMTIHLGIWNRDFLWHFSIRHWSSTNKVTCLCDGHTNSEMVMKTKMLLKNPITSRYLGEFLMRSIVKSCSKISADEFCSYIMLGNVPHHEWFAGTHPLLKMEGWWQIWKAIHFSPFIRNVHNLNLVNVSIQN